jgi:hypothetical protein
VKRKALRSLRANAGQMFQLIDQTFYRLREIRHGIFSVTK